MRPNNAPSCNSLLKSTLVLKIIFCTLALGEVVIVDDQENNPHVRWEGPWQQIVDLRAMDSTLTLGNQSDEMVTITFTGTSVQVIGVLTATSAQGGISSTYTLDNEGEIEFTPSNEDAYGIKFYNSGPLKLGSHTLTIKNAGMQLLLDYFQFDDGYSGPDTTTTGSISTATPTNTLSHSPTTIITTPSQSSSSSHDGSGISTPSTSTSPHLTMMTSVLSSTSPIPSTRPSHSVSWSLFSPFLPPPPSSSTSLSERSMYTPSLVPVASQAAPHSHGMRHSVIVGLAIVSAIGVSFLALLFQLGRRRLRDYWMRISLCLASDPPESDFDRTRPTVPDAERDMLTLGWARNVIHSCSDRVNPPIARSEDGGVRIAGGQGVEWADAPSISDGESEKSTLPPPYQETFGP